MKLISIAFTLNSRNFLPSNKDRDLASIPNLCLILFKKKSLWLQHAEFGTPEKIREYL